MLCSWWVCMCSYLNSMFNNVVAKKKAKTTNWKAPPLRSKRHTSNQPKSQARQKLRKKKSKQISQTQTQTRNKRKIKKQKLAYSDHGRQTDYNYYYHTFPVYMCVCFCHAVFGNVDTFERARLQFFWPATTPPTSPKSPSTQLLPSRYKNHTWRHGELCEFLRFCSMWLHRRGSPEGLF